MKIVLVSSGHSHSTFDVCKFYIAAFQKLGVKQRVVRYDTEVSFAMCALETFRGGEDTRHEGESIYIASRSILGTIGMEMPDAVVFITAITLFHDTMEWIHQLQANLKKPFRSVVILTESPYSYEEELHASLYANLVFTNELSFVNKLRRIQPESYYLPQAYCEDVHYPRDVDKINKLFFCGSGYPNRLDMLRDAKLGDKLEIVGKFPGIEEHSPELVPYYTDGAMRNEDVAVEYSRHAINLNIHRTSGHRKVFELREANKFNTMSIPVVVRDAYSMNNRAVEIASCQGFQICDNSREELFEVFGDSVPTFEDADDLRDKTLYYLKNEKDRDRLAMESRGKVAERTYVNNAREILRRIDV